jgi:mannitol/fructose-specific phosphotransferase system IIA component (Ntr-type)
MRMSELLNPAAVSLSLAARDKSAVLSELVGLLEQAHGIPSDGRILDSVERREAMMSTAIGFGVAIPHGKSRIVDRMVAVCGVSREGVDFGADEGAPSHLFLLFVSPEGSATEHVRTLANVSRLLKEDDVRRDLRAAKSPEAFLAAIQAAEAAHIP